MVTFGNKRFYGKEDLGHVVWWRNQEQKLDYVGQSCSQITKIVKSEVEILFNKTYVD